MVAINAGRAADVGAVGAPGERRERQEQDGSGEPLPGWPPERHRAVPAAVAARSELHHVAPSLAAGRSRNERGPVPADLCDRKIRRPAIALATAGRRLAGVPPSIAQRGQSTVLPEEFVQVPEWLTPLPDS